MSDPVGHATRTRLLDTAMKLFAAEGYKRVTVRDICREANANVAAVNYHFRDKMGLYALVVEQAAAAIRDLTAEIEQRAALRPAAERLATYVRVHCERLYALGPRDAARVGALGQLIEREIHDPTAALGGVMDSALQARFGYLASIVAELSGRRVDDPHVVRCVTSLHAQVLMFRPSPIHARFGPMVERAFAVEPVIDHILRFSLAGIGACSARARETRPARRPATRRPRGRRRAPRR